MLADRRVFGSDDDPLARVRPPPPGGPSSARARGSRSWTWCCASRPTSPPAELAGYARLGGRAAGHAGEAQLFWQMGDDEFVAPITLRAAQRADGERTICRSVVESDRLSLHRSRCRAARRAAQLPARRLRDLHERGWPVESSSAPVELAKPKRSPLERDDGPFLWRVGTGAVRRNLAGRLGEKQWFIAYRRATRSV